MQSPRSQRALLVMFIFVIVVFGVLSIRQDHMTQRIERDAYVMCMNRQANVQRTNTFYGGMILIERANPFRATSPETIDHRIELFQQAILIVPRCGKDPR